MTEIERIIEALGNRVQIIPRERDYDEDDDTARLQEGVNFMSAVMQAKAALSAQASRVAELEGALEGLLDYTEDLLRQYNCVWADCGDGGIKPEEEEDIVEARKALGRDGEG